MINPTKNTIFDNTYLNKQSYFCEYYNLMIPLNFNTNLTILIWEIIYKEFNEDKSSLRDTDME